MINWLVQKTKSEDDIAQRILYAAEELNCKAQLIQHIPFDDTDLSFLSTNEPVIYHGGISLVKSVQDRNLSLSPFSWFDFEKLSCSYYYNKWYDYIANQYYNIVSLSRLKKEKDFYYKHFSKYYDDDDIMFIRPNSNDKIFTGQLVAKSRFDNFLNWIWIDENMANTLCIIAPPVRFISEWRLFIANNKVIAASLYKEENSLSIDAHCPDEVKIYAEEVATKWSPHPIYCLDIGLTHLNEFKVIECGSVNCAGFYKADVKSVVQAMTNIAKEEFCLIN